MIFLFCASYSYQKVFNHGVFAAFSHKEVAITTYLIMTTITGAGLALSDFECSDEGCEHERILEDEG